MLDTHEDRGVSPAYVTRAAGVVAKALARLHSRSQNQAPSVIGKKQSSISHSENLFENM